MKRFSGLLLFCLLVVGCIAPSIDVPTIQTQAEETHQHDHPPDGGISALEAEGIDPAFDIVHASVVKDGEVLHFQQIVAGEAGSVIPEVTGQLGGAAVQSYVWPLSLDTATVGFEAEQGILALAATAHPDFDDTPLWDEDGDGDASNDGRDWHSHWVVLAEDDECAPGALKVKDIPEGEAPTLPATWPALPLLIDSPGYDLMLTDATVTIDVPHQALQGADSFNFDGVTAGLAINVNVHAPLLCVTAIHDIASGDLSLPGVLE